MLNSILLILFAVLPTVVISTYVYTKDENKEPPIVLLLLFCMGIVAAPVVMQIGSVLEKLFPFVTQANSTLSMLQLLFKTFIIVGFVEEFIKWIVLYFIGYRSSEFDETYDIIVYGIFVALGFATFENIFYIVINNSLQVAVQRAIFSVPAHVAFQIFMSYYLCLAKIYSMNKKKLKTFLCVLQSIFIPILFHGMFDLCLFTSKPLYIVIFYLFTTTLFLLSFERLKKIHRDNMEIIK